jgi:hypothetical protein
VAAVDSEIFVGR